MDKLPIGYVKGKGNVIYASLVASRQESTQEQEVRLCQANTQHWTNCA